NDAWQDINVGDNSFAWGVNAEAKGLASIALGTGSTASGNYSVAFGGTSTASGSYSTALSNSTASVNYSLAIGSETQSKSTATFSSGVFAEASGLYSFAHGFWVKAGSG